MKKGNLGRALFVGVFVGMVSFIKELLYPDMHSFLSILLMVVAAIMGYFLGNKVLLKRQGEKSSKTTM
ncbi:hypothetical protein CSV72_14045 [Sporosarcina sp. P20a]|uniref:hypothetical protein n=1 Tax=Sporosarcina sp. P20a TaxID=2048256 RepID=UPI000C16EA91|nr:hypothetical protein [Sporosarcina sp. P20a]PIC85351.1 hypothetical protein CSV72_14045 [Sporosarcina sp. P20a]